MTTETEAIATMVKASAHPPQVLQVVDPDSGEVVVLTISPDNMTVRDLTKDLDARRDNPRRRTGTVAVKSLDSFIEMVNRNKDARAIVYADDSAKPVITAVMNDHMPGNDAPGHRDHRVVYAPELSSEWQAWTGRDGKPMDSGAFAEFLEEHALDMRDPAAGIGDGTQKIIDALGVKPAAPATIRGLARDLTVRVNSKVTDARNLQSGEAQLVFESSHTTVEGKPLAVPGAFLVALPIYRGGPGYLFVARLRYRVSNGGISWSYSLASTDVAKREVMAEMIATIREKVGALVVEGQPG